MSKGSHMTEQENVKLIQDHFAAFGRGDLEQVLNMVAEEVDWQSPATRTERTEITWSKKRHSREQVAQFFQELDSAVQPERFEIVSITAQDDRVVIEGRNQGRVRSTGHTYEHEWVMVFTIQDGKIVRNRHYYDTADIVAAFQ
jgi:steroid delta-isomerase-like uncharacterized protein